MSNITILYLYAELMGYQIPIFEELIENYKVELHIVHWDKKKLTPYIPPKLRNVKYYNRSEYNRKELLQLADKIQPNLMYISGWMDKDYLYVAKQFRKTNIPIVAGSDTQWKGNIRQWIASIIFPYTVKRCFSHIWVAGPYQYEYARKLSFKKKEIIFNCLSANTDLFNQAYSKSLQKKKENYSHKFLYVGRFEKIKGLEILIKAWSDISREDKKDWELCLIGNGTMKTFLEKQTDVIVMDFMQPDDLAEEIEAAGCFILPSLIEPWALVLHEFAAAGMPIICSEVCGAAPVFVINAYNGYIFKNGSVLELQKSMKKVIATSDEDLFKMGERSHQYGQKISPKVAAASLMSIMDE